MEILITASFMNKLLDEAKWSGKVKVKWHPKEGFFTQSAADIASGLKNNSKSAAQAQSRLSFYINRSGNNLSDERRSALEKARGILSKSYA